MTSRNKNDVKKLFEYWCELNQDGIITESFPENFRDKKTIADIPSFAFPCDTEGECVQLFSFVLTTDDSKWRFGFCRQDPKTKTAMVLITYLPWHDTFSGLLTVLTDLRRPNVPKDEFRAFIKEAYNRGVPEADASFEIFYNAGKNYFVFERPRQFQLPSIPGNVSQLIRQLKNNLNLCYAFVGPKNMIPVFAAMLAERRIIFTSRYLYRISSCIQAAHAFLYPMVWQHIFIPVLPMKLKDYLSAPMPYLIGVPESVLEMMTPEELGEVVIMNCDTIIFESPFDDVHELPNEIVSQLKKQLINSNDHLGDRVSKIFLGVLVQLIGTYRDGVEFRESGKVFNRDRFIESRPSHLRPFLTKMMELQIFQQFIDERLEMLNTGLGFSDEFELETARYAEQMKKRGRKYAFLKNVKDKTNPAVKSAVKSVKESSRGVKTAYKDLKSKFRDIPRTTNFRSHLGSNSQHDHIDGYQLGKANGTTGGHRSAPSSPIYSKRSAGFGAIGNFQYAVPKVLNGANQQQLQRTPTPLATSSSSAHIDTMVSPDIAHISNNLGTSPTVSPASSVSSSDMNLSQELQNHPLFKTPIVDRSLKPSGNINSNARVAGHQQQSTPERPPQTVQYYNHPYLAHRSATHLQLLSTHSHKHVIGKPPAMPRCKQFVNNSIATSSILSSSTPNKIITTKSTYDNPPEMQSPPVPPRRQCSANISEASSYTSANLSDSDCFKDTQRLSSSNTSTISSTSSSSAASFVSAMSSFSQHKLGIEAPKPIPRNKREKESLRSLQPKNLKVQQPNLVSAAGSLTSVVPSMSSQEETINDLISLEDSHNSSFDLEDFDPLNQNARPLPLFYGGNVTTAKSTTLPATTALSISNPIYPYFTPPNISGRTVLDTTPPDATPPPLPSTSPPRDDDFELLRKYGLDQFTLTTNTNGDADNAVSNNLKTMNTTMVAAATTNVAATTTINRRNWTTFE